MLALLTAASVGLFGCAHTAMRGSVAMKTSDNEAHVCMGEGEVKPGDRVRLFKNVCHSKGPSGAYSGAGAGCEKKEIGEGTVKEILNQHYSLVKFDQGIQVEEGTFVEKL
ncbi:MAG: hypothetical protein C5B49_06570 [Bdellovibrio sp.]|nr:MAG: hypothetical protein C5B49_06570 [Bdellovibrio sp.]